MEILDQGSLPPDTRAELFREVGEMRTLGDLLEWSGTLSPPVPAPEIITQDEYTHDVLVPWRANLVLVFDTT